MNDYKKIYSKRHFKELTNVTDKVCKRGAVTVNHAVVSV